MYNAETRQEISEPKQLYNLNNMHYVTIYIHVYYMAEINGAR